MGNLTWQTISGSIEIPEGWFVFDANFDCDEPYIEICSDIPEYAHENRRLPFPKSLAYYLTTHWCGSRIMHDSIRLDAERVMRNNIANALGLYEIFNQKRNGE